MQVFKHFKKVLWTGALTLVMSAFVPFGTSQAAASADAYDMVRSIFSRVKIGYAATVLDEDSTAPASTVAKQESGNTQQQAKSSALADRIIQTGEKYLGTPYKFGASSNQTNYFDCSSFVQRVFRENGINLPRNSRQQSKVGTYVPRNQLRKGDLVFFTTSRYPDRISHVGIYAGNNKLLHTWGPGGVRYDDMSKTRWLRERYVTARRVIN